ncbi:hypothetical protein Hanom_Chr03g00181721 [Helianthus anomalus]
MNRALKDFQSKYPSGFHLVEAWEVVNKHDKWTPVPLLGEDSGSSGQKRKSSDSGNYNAGTLGTEFNSDIPYINVDPSPTRPRKKDKRPTASPTNSETALTEKLSQYTLMKEAKQARAIELLNIKKKREEDTIALVAEQREAVKQLLYDRDLETFTKPHDHASPEMLPFILVRKRDIAKKYNWPCNF